MKNCKEVIRGWAQLYMEFLRVCGQVGSPVSSHNCGDFGASNEGEMHVLLSESTKKY